MCKKLEKEKSEDQKLENKEGEEKKSDGTARNDKIKKKE